MIFKLLFQGKKCQIFCISKKVGFNLHIVAKCGVDSQFQSVHIWPILSD